ncbi:hypothetical protein HK104_001908 [Borealophlyctis nickersoniae]|nr:hypothetical protein HK104_001908 [Borealophlyctis nickersoniae]
MFEVRVNWKTLVVVGAVVLGACLVMGVSTPYGTAAPVEIQKDMLPSVVGEEDEEERRDEVQHNVDAEVADAPVEEVAVEVVTGVKVVEFVQVEKVADQQVSPNAPVHGTWFAGQVVGTISVSTVQVGSPDRLPAPTPSSASLIVDQVAGSISCSLLELKDVQPIPTPTPCADDSDVATSGVSVDESVVAGVVVLEQGIEDESVLFVKDANVTDSVVNKVDVVKEDVSNEESEVQKESVLVAKDSSAKASMAVKDDIAMSVKISLGVEGGVEDDVVDEVIQYDASAKAAEGPFTIVQKKKRRNNRNKSKSPRIDTKSKSSHPSPPPSPTKSSSSSHGSSGGSPDGRVPPSSHIQPPSPTDVVVAVTSEGEVKSTYLNPTAMEFFPSGTFDYEETVNHGAEGGEIVAETDVGGEAVLEEYDGVVMENALVEVGDGVTEDVLAAVGAGAYGEVFGSPIMTSYGEPEVYVDEGYGPVPLVNGVPDYTFGSAPPPPPFFPASEYPPNPYLGGPYLMDPQG